MREDLPETPALRVLAPPPGGLARLRARLDHQRPRRRWWLLAVPVAVAATIVIVWLRPRAPAPMPAAPATALRDHDIGGGAVTFYWVASTPARMRPTAVPVATVSTVSITDAPQVATYGATR